MAESVSTIAPTAVPSVKVNRFLAQVYMLMSLGLVVTGIVSIWTVINLNLMFAIATRPWLAFGLFIIQIMLVVFLSARVMSMSTGAAAFVFLIYAALTGVTLSSIFVIYSQEQIYSVFFFTAGTFLITSLAGLLIKKDMSGAGNALFMRLTGWILAWIVSWFFPSSNFNWALNFLGIGLFVGLTAWDTQQLKMMAQKIGDQAGAGGMAVLGALKLYLDFINLFLLLLRVSNR